MRPIIDSPFRNPQVFSNFFNCKDTIINHYVNIALNRTKGQQLRVVSVARGFMDAKTLTL
jgi:hypothetical protein